MGETADFVTVLECQETHRLAKLYTDPGLAPLDYSAGFLYRAEEIPIESLSDLGLLVEALASDSTRCVIRGRLRPGAAEWVPRRSSDKHEHEPDFEAAPHRWFCIDLDASIVALDPADPRASIEAWRASLPPALANAGMVFQLSAKAHLFPYLRGHAWFIATDPVDDATLRAWYVAHDFDPALAQAVQIHYTADPVFEGCADPFEGRRVYMFEGPPADIDWALALRPGVARTPARVAPEGAPADGGVLDVLGPAIDHEGHRWFLCGALGGVWRRMGWTASKARATIEAWLEPVPGADIEAGVRRCLGAWELPFDQASGKGELVTHLGGDEAWAERVAAASNGRRRAPSDTFAPIASDLIGDVSSPPLLSAPKRQMYIRDDSGGYFGPIPLDLMHGTLRAVSLLDVLGRDADGKVLSDDRLYRSGAPVHTIARSFEETGTRYDGDEFTLHRGYLLPTIEPVRHEAVEAWMLALAGGMLPHLLDWIALCSQANIGRRAAALVIVGEHSTGKSLTFKALARMWGAVTFVPLKDAAAQFNASICDSPIVCDDECVALKSRLISSEEFRERVQARSRKYEPKGQEKVLLLGYTREGIAANATDEVTISRVYTASTREAVEKRLCVINVGDTEATRAALLAIAGGNEDEELRILGEHFAWIWATHEVASVERFAGAGGEAVHEVSLASTAEDGSDLWEYVGAFLESEERLRAEPGPKAPLVVHEGTLMAYPAGLAKMLALLGGRWDVKLVQRILGPVRTGERHAVKAGGGTVRYWPLDWDRVIDLCGVDADALASRLP